MLDPVLIQSALKAAGHYSGALDGVFGPRSRAAADAALKEAGVPFAAWPHSRRMVAIRQWVLKGAGFDPGPIDGVEGPKTRAAAYAFSKPVGVELPWITEAEKVIGHHEVVDNEELRAWLRRDGATLGDPAKLPWCGDFVETAIKLALPKEKVPANTYLARNWADWGEDATRRYGEVILFVLICLAQIIGGAILPKTNGFAAIGWTLACLAVYTLSFWLIRDFCRRHGREWPPARP